MSPGRKPGRDNAVVKVGRRPRRRRPPKKKGKKKKSAQEESKSKGPGSCGVNMYYSKKDRNAWTHGQKK